MTSVCSLVQQNIPAFCRQRWGAEMHYGICSTSGVAAFNWLQTYEIIIIIISCVWQDLPYGFYTGDVNNLVGFLRDVQEGQCCKPRHKMQILFCPCKHWHHNTNFTITNHQSAKHNVRCKTFRALYHYGPLVLAALLVIFNSICTEHLIVDCHEAAL